MKMFIAKEICVFGPGTKLSMTPDQAKTRMHNLRSIGKDAYETTAHVSFKRGETFGYDGPMTRALGDMVQPVEAPAAKPEGDSGTRRNRR